MATLTDDKTEYNLEITVENGHLESELSEVVYLLCKWMTKSLCTIRSQSQSLVYRKLNPLQEVTLDL